MPDDGLRRAGIQALLNRLGEAPPHRAAFQPLPHQQAPSWDDDSWDTWLLLAGRGTGKTLAGAYFINELLSANRGWRARIIAPTLGDAREAAVLGDTGLIAVNPSLKWRINEGAIVWPNGSRARIFGAFSPEDVERLRAGGNSNVDWYEELAAWPKLDEALDQAMFGLRLGPHPRMIVTTTPKPKDRLRRLIANAGTRITKASTRDNPHLSERVRASLFDAYEGSRLGRQELEAELLEDVEGALWSSSMIDPFRVQAPPKLVRTIVAIDPAKTSRKDSDLSGIIVVGRGEDGHGYVLADLSGRFSPRQWGERCIRAYDAYDASYIVCETNIAGELVTSNIASLDSRVPVKGVRSRQSKHGRALPAVSLYEQSRVHHVGILRALEDEQYAFTGSGESVEADDRVDALVLGLTELALIREHMESKGWRVYA